MISHDRDFLDAVVTHVAHIEGSRSRCTPATTAPSSAPAPSSLASSRRCSSSSSARSRTWKSYIDRFRAKATKARQAQSRIKALARMEEVTAAHVDTPFEFRFFEPVGSPIRCCMLEDAAAGYGDKPCCRD
jgi:ATP-binding cassette subfamily F protein 3